MVTTIDTKSPLHTTCPECDGRGTADEEPCGRRIWDGRYWCVLPVGHDGPHESAPFGTQELWSEPEPTKLASGSVYQGPTPLPCFLRTGSPLAVQRPGGSTHD